MLLLGIDTSTKILSLAIINNNEIAIDYKINRASQTHSALILPALNSMLHLSGIKLNEIEGIAVSIGPGSFTGLRIGLSTAKGLAFALNIPLIGVNSLESLAFTRISLPGILCPIIKARKDEYYYALYLRKNNGLDIIRDYQCANWVSIVRVLSTYQDNAYLFGEGIEEILEDEKINGHSHRNNINFVTDKQYAANALSIALLGQKRILKKDYDDIYKLSPLYINKSAAEVLMEKKNQR